MREKMKLVSVQRLAYHNTRFISTYGNGAMIAVKPASKAVAPTVPSRRYMAPANSGKAAAKDDRRALLLAMADAAMGRYAVTRYVKTDVKTK